MSCPAWLRDLQPGARAIVDSGAADVLAVVEVALGALSTIGLNPLGAIGVTAPAAFIIRWIAGGCGPMEAAARQQMALVHDYIVLQGLVWAAAGAVVVGTTTVAVPIIGTIGSAALVAGIGALFAAAAAVAGFLATGEAPSSFEAALLPLTPLGRWAIDPLLGAVQFFGFDVETVREALRTRRVKDAIKDAQPRRREDGNMADGNTGPILTWPGLQVPVAPPPPGSTATATGATLSFAYQRAYLAAARATWRDLGDARDLRPWLIAQTAWDLEYIAPKLRAAAAMQAARIVEFRRLRAAVDMLNAWQKSALPLDAAGGVNAPGPWSRSTVERLLLQRGVMQGLVPDGVDEGSGAPDSGGGGGAAVVAVIVAGLVAALR